MGTERREDRHGNEGREEQRMCRGGGGALKGCRQNQGSLLAQEIFVSAGIKLNKELSD